MHIIINRNKAHIREEIARKVWAKFSVKYTRIQWTIAVLGAVFLLLSYSINAKQFWSLESSVGIAFILTAIFVARSTYKSKGQFFKTQESYSLKLQSAAGSQNFEITENHIAYSDALSTMTMKWDAFTNYAHDNGILTIFFDEHLLQQWAWLDIEFKPEDLQLLLSFLDQKFKGNQQN